MNNQARLIKKGRCHCIQCGPRVFNDKSDGGRTKSRGTKSHKDYAHKLRVRQLRRAKLDKGQEVVFDRTVGYTD